uniref:Uncharacterized protein n=1 Tax=Anguilla anguilla TaxID=7936 RepID=A0A0E9STL3_ANGAN
MHRYYSIRARTPRDYWSVAAPLVIP